MHHPSVAMLLPAACITILSGTKQALNNLQGADVRLMHDKHGHGRDPGVLMVVIGVGERVCGSA
jgi:hypothetical protein